MGSVGMQEFVGVVLVENRCRVQISTALCLVARTLGWAALVWSGVLWGVCVSRLEDLVVFAGCMLQLDPFSWACVDECLALLWLRLRVELARCGLKRMCVHTRGAF